MTTVILTMTAIITVWVYAIGFVEPTAGPNDSDQDFLQNILGANNNNNDFLSDQVAFNPDGSIIEREEYIQMGIGTTTDASSMSSTLFAGQQYVADNMALASNYTSTRAGYLDSIPTISGYHTVPTADTTNNAQMRDVVGNKTDAAVTTVGTTKSLMGYIKGLLGLAGGASDSASMSTTLFAGQQYIYNNLDKVQWAGYTSGAFYPGGTSAGQFYTMWNYYANYGANDRCNAIYAGSHACTFNDLSELGPNYPATYGAWVVDGSYTTYDGTNAIQMTKDGATNNNTNSTFPMCGGWIFNGAGYYGPYISATDGGIGIGLAACNVSKYLPCCY